MHIRFIIFMLAVLSVNAARAKCGHLTTNPDDAVVYSANGKQLSIRNTVIAGRVADRMIKILTEQLVEKIAFDCIPGGLAHDVRRLFDMMPRYDTQVVGACNSACAILAMNSKSLELMPSGSKDYPTSLMIHATFDISTLRASEEGLNRLNFYDNRLRVIPRGVLSSVLSEKRIGNYGLVITRDLTDTLSNRESNAYWCQPYPDDCHPIEFASLERMNIHSSQEDGRAHMQ